MSAFQTRWRVVVHDYSGHPCQMQLSRELARGGHVVTHQFSPSYTTGRGAVEPLPDDPETLVIEPVRLPRAFSRYSPVTRVRQEIEYGLLAGRRIVDRRPDVAVLSNIPLLAMLLVVARLRRRRVPFVFWHQDVYSEGIAAIARERLGPVGRAIGWVAARVERWVARSAALVVPISDLFLPRLHAWGVEPARIEVVPNWAALEEMPALSRRNCWSTEHGLDHRQVLLYAGTLGLKHDPLLLADAAEQLAGEAAVVVVSEGRGREILEGARRDRGLENLLLVDFQPYEDLPAVLASADVLLTLLEPHASRYSVPSKTLNYLCVGRPVVASIAADNAVAEMLTASGGGVVVPPGDATAIVAAARGLLADPERAEVGARARDYAERVFPIKPVVVRFEDILDRAASSPRHGAHRSS